MKELQAKIESGKLQQISTAEDVKGLPEDTEAVYVSELDDDKALALVGLGKIRAIVQNGAPTITDRGVSCLVNVATLEWLDLEWGVRLTDRALDSIAQLANLKYLDISFCSGITTAGIDRLKTIRLKLEIEV